MRHADFSIAPTAATAATSATAATRPTAAIGDSGGAGFGRLFSELRGEVNAYIQHGDIDGGAAGSLSAEGALLRLRAQGLIMGEDERVDPATASGGAAANTPEQQAFLDSIAPWARQAAPYAVTWPAGITPLQKATALHQLNALGILVRSGA